MATLTKQQINQRINKLPTKLDEALFDYDNIALVSNLQASYRLSEEQTQNLSRIVGRVLMGFIIIDSLVGKIASSLNVDQTTAQRIATTLSKKIFIPLKADIENFRKQINAEETTASANVLDLKKVVTQPKQSFPPKKSISQAPPQNGLNRSQVAPQNSTAPKPLEQFSSPQAQNLQPAPPQQTPPPAPNPPIQKDFTRDNAPATPFIIHQESEVRPVAPYISNEPTNTPEISTRQIGDNQEPESIQARVEIGQTIHEKKRQDQTTPAYTKRTEQKIINFGASAPKVKDPFGGIGLNKNKDNNPKVTGNTVDLRNNNNG